MILLLQWPKYALITTIHYEAHGHWQEKHFTKLTQFFAKSI